MEEARISSLMSGMAEAGEGAVASSDAIGSMIGAQSAAIAQLVRQASPRLFFTFLVLLVFPRAFSATTALVAHTRIDSAVV